MSGGDLRLEFGAPLVAGDFRWTLTASGYEHPDADDAVVADIVAADVEISYPLVGTYQVAQRVAVLGSELARFAGALAALLEGTAEAAELNDLDGCLRLCVERASEPSKTPFEVSGLITAGYGVRMSFDEAFVDASRLTRLLAETRALSRALASRR